MEGTREETTWKTKAYKKLGDRIQTGYTGLRRETGQLVSFCELGNESLDPLNECQIHKEVLMVLTTCRVRSAARSLQTFILFRGDIVTLHGRSNSRLS